MADVAGRRKRARGTGGTVPLQTKVPAHVKERWEQLANSRAISLSVLFEELIDQLVPRTTTQEPSTQKGAALELTS